MNHPEIEAGQKYKDDDGEYDILKIWEDEQRGLLVAFFDTTEPTVITLEVEKFFHNPTVLTHLADGTKYTAPNDYRHGDIWRHLKSKKEYFIHIGSDEVIRYVGYQRTFNMLNATAFTKNPQHFKLVHRKESNE